jgi:hypothetical protein
VQHDRRIASRQPKEKTLPTSEKPIACTLDRSPYEDRVTAIRTLFARALKRSQRDGQRLHLTLDASARADVEDMIRKEKSCCAFLDFDLSDTGDAILLTITAPSGAAAEEVFAPFAADASCGCASASNADTKSGKVLSVLGLGGIGAAFLCGAACVAAAILAAAGVGGAWISVLAGFDALVAPIFALAAAALAAAWILRRRAVKRSARPHLVEKFRSAAASTRSI